MRYVGNTNDYGCLGLGNEYTGGIIWKVRNR